MSSLPLLNADSGPHIVEDSGWVYRTCSACTTNCRGLQPSKLCCTCYWSRTLNRRARGEVKACKQCKDHLTREIDKVVQHERTSNGADYLAKRQLEFEASGLAGSARAKICGHTFCILQLDMCCACFDRRNTNSKYKAYVDGTGFVASTRFANYCTACRVADGILSVQNADAAVQTETVHAHLKAAVKPIRKLLAKDCSHDSCLLTMTSCCACSDRRPLESKLRQFLDAQGFWYRVLKDEGYCSSCKERTPPAMALPDQIVFRPAPQTEKLHLTPKICGHAFCHLTTANCCACTDDRPIGTRYDKYVDGIGILEGEGAREEGYCPACRAAATVEVTIGPPPLPRPTRRVNPNPPSYVPKLKATAAQSVSKRTCGHDCGGLPGRCCNCALQSRSRRYGLQNSPQRSLDSFCDTCQARSSCLFSTALLQEALPLDETQVEAPTSRMIITQFAPAVAPAQQNLPTPQLSTETEEGDDDWTDPDMSDLGSEWLVDDTDSLCSWVDTGEMDDDEL